jgi:predicted transcriptional regulator
MARPKLPTAQRKGMVMTVRMRLDLNDGLAAVALLRGTTRSGLVSQYAAEQIRVEHESKDSQPRGLKLFETGSLTAAEKQARSRSKTAC